MSRKCPAMNCPLVTLELLDMFGSTLWAGCMAVKAMINLRLLRSNKGLILNHQTGLAALTKFYRELPKTMKRKVFDLTADTKMIEKVKSFAEEQLAFEQISHAACRSGLLHRKYFRECVEKSKVTVLTSEQILHILQRMTSCEEEKQLAKWRRVVPFQLHYILFRIECVIRLCGEEKKKLLGRHGELTKCLGVEQSYSDLFRGTAPEHLESMLNFPRELVRLIAGYTRFGCYSEEDREEIYSRILLMSND